MSVQAKHNYSVLQTDFPVPPEYYIYFYKPSLLNIKNIPLGFIYNDTSKVTI